MEDQLKPEDFTNYREMYKVAPRPEPKIDELVSKAVGRPIYVTNPRLIAQVAKWKKEKGDSEEFDNFLDDPVRVEELKKIL